MDSTGSTPTPGDNQIQASRHNKQQMRSLGDLHDVVFEEIIDHVVMSNILSRTKYDRCSIAGAVRVRFLRLPCHRNDDEGYMAHMVSSAVPPFIKGQFITTGIRRGKTTKDEDKHVDKLVRMNQRLDELTQPTDERRIEQHEFVAEAYFSSNYDDVRESWLSCSEAEKESQNLFCGAIVLGDLGLVKHLLEGSASPLARLDLLNPDFGLPLPLAAAWGHLHIIRYLLDKGADLRLIDYPCPDESDDDVSGRIGGNIVCRCARGSALRAAVFGGYEEIVRLLMRPEHRLPRSNREYRQAMVAGARAGHLHLCELLIRNDGTTLLDFPRVVALEMFREAATLKREDVTRMILSSGVTLDQLEYNSYSDKLHDYR
ncbi:hypothetical protein M426DRAFT_263998 [Hypoxylon sp. CI-4A]|nr:hypothetical protein M426DRAFT_263998 [Hypoxylon sp. CI-4A]